MMIVWMLLISSLSVPIFAAEFNHIKLNPQFEQYLTQPKMKSLSPQMKSLSASSSMEALSAPAPLNDFSQQIKSSLLGIGSSSAKTDFTSPFPTDGEESPLLQEIRNQLQADHQALGQQQLNQLNLVNQQFNMGVDNFSGFSWQKPFGVVHVYADRQVNPNLLGTNWLIQDTFTFEIDATSFLEKLNQAGLATMSALEIGAFAGITFKRVYTYYHYANSFQDGLKSDFSKLFLPFVFFNQSGLSKMGKDEIMKREDNWSVSAGGLITTPPLYSMSVSAGVLAEYAYQQTVAVQNNEVADATAEKVRLTVHSKKAASIGATLSLQLDFFKLIKFTLLNYDLTYEYAASKDYILGMSQPQLTHVTNDAVEGGEFRKILRGWGQVQALEPYVVRLDETDSSSLQTRGSVLIWGKLQKSKTEQIRIIKDQVVKTFYKNYSLSTRVVQNFFSRLFSAVLYKLLKLPVGVKNAALYNRQVNLEYDATNPQAGNINVIRIDSTDQFSFILTQSYEAARTDKWLDSRFKNDVIWFIDTFTTLPKDYKGIVRSNQLKGPLIVESTLRVEKAGFDYLLAQTENNVFGNIAKVCGSDRLSDWTSDDKRKIMLTNDFNDAEDEETTNPEAEICVQDMGQKFITFKTDYKQNALKPSLARFKDFLTKYYKRAGTITDLVSLFGESNTFINGRLQATTSQGANFVTSFSSGQFRGLGVIDNFKRSNGDRTPASIVSE
jgi:hypothetical protein